MAGCGAQLCDQLCFPRSIAALRQARLRRAAEGTAPLLLDVDVAREQSELLPTWYLLP